MSFIMPITPLATLELSCLKSFGDIDFSEFPIHDKP